MTDPRWDYDQTTAAMADVKQHIQAAISTLSDLVAWEQNTELNHLYVSCHLRPALTHLLRARDEVAAR